MEFSVLIPAFNAVGTITRAVQSAAHQNYKPKEIIVCDDGSTDGTRLLLGRLPVRVVEQEHLGPAAARNAAAGVATGDYLVLLDADDSWHPDRLHKMSRVLRSRPELEMCTTDAWVVSGNRRERYYHRKIPPPEKGQEKEILRTNFVFGSAAVAADAWRRVGGFATSESPDGDYRLWIDLILTGSRCGFVDEPLAVYYRSPGSLSSDRIGSHRGVIAMLEKVPDRHPLDVRQMEALEAHLSRLRARIALYEAHEAVRARSPGARRLAWAIAADRRNPLLRRFKWALRGALRR